MGSPTHFRKHEIIRRSAVGAKLPGWSEMHASHKRLTSVFLNAMILLSMHIKVPFHLINLHRKLQRFPLDGVYFDILDVEAEVSITAIGN